MGWYLDGSAFSARTLQIRTFVPLAGEPCVWIGDSGNDTYIHYREHKVLLFFCYRAVVAAERDIPPIREM
jgi:hypothetical protein